MLLFVVIMNYLLLLFQLIDSIGYRLPLLLLSVGQSTKIFGERRDVEISECAWETLKSMEIFIKTSLIKKFNFSNEVVNF